MKKNAVPELSQKWWSKNKAKTMKKSGLGNALKDFEVAEDLMDYDRMLKALSEVKKKVVVALQGCNEKAHAETIAALKKYPGVIQKRETEIKAKQKEVAARAPAQDAPKQKLGKSVVIWKKDLGADLLKLYKPAWVKDIKGYEFKLTLNEDLLDVLEAEGDLVTPQQMVDDANELTKKLLSALVKLMKQVEAAADKEADPARKQKIYELFDTKAKQVLTASKPHFQKIPESRWAAFVKRNKQYRDYKVKTGFDITLGVLGVAGGAVGVAGAAATGGASLVLGIISLVRGVAALADKIKDAARSAEKVEKVLESDLNTLKSRYQTVLGDARKGAQGATEITGSVLKGLLGTDTPYMATLPKCDKNFGLWQNKVAGLAVAGRKLSAAIARTLTECDKLEKILKKSADAKARKYLDKLRKARASLDKALNECSDMMGRVGSADKNAPKLETLLNALKAQNPKYADIFDRVFPAVVNLTLAGANAGVGLKEAANTLESLNAGLGLMNDILSEGKDQLEAAIG